MKNVTNMSRTREGIAPPTPTAAVWKASRYKLEYEGYNLPQRVEAEHDASWLKVDPFETYTPVGTRIFDENVPHVSFSKLAGMWREYNRKDRNLEKIIFLYKVMKVFADRYGLLGLFRETFAAPVLPSRVDRYAWLAPDAVIGKDGRLRVIDPTTEGKERLEELLDLRNPRTGQKESFEPDRLAFPQELRFPSIRFTAFGLLPPVFESLDTKMWSWKEVRDLYGVRVLLDKDAGLSCVSIVPTREPLSFWEIPLLDLPRSPCPPESLNSRLEGVAPHAVAGEDGKPKSSWRCPSLLKAIYLMLYLDETSGGKIQECQAPGCPNYFRVGPRSRDSMYCPPPPGKKQSLCASRASSRMYRERQRRSPDTT